MAAAGVPYRTKKLDLDFTRPFEGLKSMNAFTHNLLESLAMSCLYCFLHVIAAIKERMETQIDSISKLAQGVKAKVETLDKAVICPFPSDLCQSLLIVRIEIT
jgi:hypothetical protein